MSSMTGVPQLCIGPDDDTVELEVTKPSELGERVDPRARGSRPSVPARVAGAGDDLESREGEAKRLARRRCRGAGEGVETTGESTAERTSVFIEDRERNSPRSQPLLPSSDIAW